MGLELSSASQVCDAHVSLIRHVFDQDVFDLNVSMQNISLVEASYRGCDFLENLFHLILCQ